MTTITATPASATPSKLLHVGLWAVQILLGLAFLMAGFTKLTTPIDQLLAMMPWVESTPAALVRFIGASELAAGIGLVLPSATRIQPRLTIAAAAGLVLVMILAALLHAVRGEWGALPINFVLGGLAAFVAWGRATRSPIAPRT